MKAFAWFRFGKLYSVRESIQEFGQRTMSEAMQDEVKEVHLFTNEELDALLLEMGVISQTMVFKKHPDDFPRDEFAALAELKRRRGL